MERLTFRLNFAAEMKNIRMSKKDFYLFKSCWALLPLFLFLWASCSDDHEIIPEEVVESDVVEPELWASNEKIAAPTWISPSVPLKFAAAVRARVGNVVNAADVAEVVVVDSEGYSRGEVADDKIAIVYDPADEIVESFGEYDDEDVLCIGINKLNGGHFLVGEPDDDSDMAASLNSLVDWINTTQSNGVSGTVVMEENNYGATYSGEIDNRILKPALSKELRLKGKYCVNIHADVRPLHSFRNGNQEAKDYYVVTLRTTVESKGMYHGRQTKKYGGVHARYCGYFLRSLNLQARLADSRGQVPKGAAFVSVPKPETSIGATSYTSGYSYGITTGVTAGANFGASLKGGITLESSTSRTISDCEIANRSKSPTVIYEYSIKNLPKYKSLAITSPPDISISSATFYNEWIWAVPTKDQDDDTEYKMLIDISNFVYGAAHFYSSGADFKSEKFPIPDRQITLSIKKPNRWQTGMLWFSNKKANTYLTNFLLTGNNRTFGSKSQFGKDDVYKVYLPVGNYNLSCDVKENKELRSYMYDGAIKIAAYDTTYHNSSEIPFKPKK